MGNLGINDIIGTIKQLPYFTKQNLGVAIQKDGEDLNYWIKKLTREKLILPIKKGFYISPYYRDTQMKTPEQSELYWACVANVLRTPSYVSLEYVLSKYNIIPEAAFAVTSVTRKSSRMFKTDQVIFVYRTIKPDLFYGYQSIAFDTSGLTVKIAYPYKALFDFLYLRPFPTQTELKAYLLNAGRFNWDALPKDDKEKFVKTVKTSGSKKLQAIVRILKKGSVL